MDTMVVWRLVCVALTSVSASASAFRRLTRNTERRVQTETLATDSCCISLASRKQRRTAAVSIPPARTRRSPAIVNTRRHREPKKGTQSVHSISARRSFPLETHRTETAFHNHAHKKKRGNVSLPHQKFGQDDQNTEEPLLVLVLLQEHQQEELLLRLLLARAQHQLVPFRLTTGGKREKTKAKPVK